MVPKLGPISRLEHHLPTSTPNIASLDHLTENVHNVLGQIWQATSNTGLVVKRGSMKGTFTLYYNIFTLHCLPTSLVR